MIVKLQTSQRSISSSTPERHLDPDCPGPDSPRQSADEGSQTRHQHLLLVQEDVAKVQTS